MRVGAYAPRLSLCSVFAATLLQFKSTISQKQQLSSFPCRRTRMLQLRKPQQSCRPITRRFELHAALSTQQRNLASPTPWRWDATNTHFTAVCARCRSKTRTNLDSPNIPFIYNLPCNIKPMEYSNDSKLYIKSGARDMTVNVLYCHIFVIGGGEARETRQIKSYFLSALFLVQL